MPNDQLQLFSPHDLCECGHSRLTHQRAQYSTFPCVACRCHDFFDDPSPSEATYDLLVLFRVVEG